MTEQKRTRIDPTASGSSNSQENAAPKAPSPTAAAKEYIEQHVASLSPHLAPILERTAKEHLALLLKRQNTKALITKFAKVADLDPSDADAMASLESKNVPRSARLNFQITADSEVMEDAHFTNLQNETNLYVKQIQVKLTGFVKEAKILQLKHQDIALDKSLANSMFIIAKACSENGEAQDPDDPNAKLASIQKAHTIVNSILDNNHELALKYATQKDLAQFRSGYQALHNLMNLPEPETINIAQSPARRGATANNDPTGQGECIGFGYLGIQPEAPTLPTPPRPPSQTQTLIVTVKRYFEALLNYPFETYLAHTKEESKAVALRKLNTEIFTTKATEETAMQLDAEAAPSAETVLELIQKESNKNNAMLLKKIAQLEQKLSKPGNSNSNSNSNNNRQNNRRNQNPNNRRGQRSRSASRKKENASKKNNNRNNNNSQSNNSRRRNSNGSNNSNAQRNPQRGRNTAAAANRDSTGNNNSSGRRSRSNSSSKKKRSNSKRGSNRQSNRSNRN